MISKKLLFCVMLGITVVQSIKAAEIAEDPIFDLLSQPMELQRYLAAYPTKISLTDSNKRSPLRIALMFNMPAESIQVLLDAGADPNEVITVRDLRNPHLPPKVFNFLHDLARKYKAPDIPQETKDNIEKQAIALILSKANDSMPDYQGHTPRAISPELFELVDASPLVVQANESLALNSLMFELGKKRKTEVAVNLAQLLGHPMNQNGAQT